MLISSGLMMVGGSIHLPCAASYLLVSALRLASASKCVISVPIVVA
jgi:hypothetical protein